MNPLKNKKNSNLHMSINIIEIIQFNLKYFIFINIKIKKIKINAVGLGSLKSKHLINQ